MSTSRDELRTRRDPIRTRRRRLHWILLVFVVLLAGAGIWCWWIAAQIRYFANTDQSQAADAIVVFGAAE